MSEAPPPLQELRQRIDALDDQLLALLNQRAQIAQAVGRWKAGQGQPVFRPERELQVIERLRRGNAGPLAGEHVASIWREIMSACRGLEEPQRVAYLGPPGTFSEEAAQRFFGEANTRVPCGTLDEVFRAVASRACQFGVVPVENSAEGGVGRALDLLLAFKPTLCGEISLTVRHSLLARVEQLREVRVVCAHPQALAQCHQWLNQNLPGVERRPMHSNAEGARVAAEKPAAEGWAAIAGMQAALIYGLNALASDIQDDPLNRTRFVVLGEVQPAPSGRDCTSLILTVANRAGAVYDMLRPLAEEGVSMRRFESRPARSGQWEYYFYVDLEGHREEQHVARALARLQSATAELHVLGSFPAWTKP